MEVYNLRQMKKDKIPKRIDIVLNGVLQSEDWKIRIVNSAVQEGTFNQRTGYVTADVSDLYIDISDSGVYHSELQIYNSKIIIPKSARYTVYLKGNFDISDNVTRTGSSSYRYIVFMESWTPSCSGTSARISAGYKFEERTYPYTLNEGSFRLIPIAVSRYIGIQSITPQYSIGSIYYYEFHSNKLIDLYMIRED